MQANFVVIRKNFVNSNGNIGRLTDTEDAAISLYNCHDVTVDQNYIVNSARNGISASYGSLSYGHKILRNVIHNWNLEGVASNQNTSAIYLTSFGNTPYSGRLTVHNNTIYSNQSSPYLIGLQVNLPYASDTLRNTSVKNNIVYIKGNNHRGTRGMRISRNQLSASAINYNNIYVEGAAARAYQIAELIKAV